MSRPMAAVTAKRARHEPAHLRREDVDPYSGERASVARFATQYSGAAMIWYLLYPFRGTTEPPVLGAAHPIRRAFTQYGRAAARHPVITLLISVAVAAILIYPFPYLYTNDFTNGSSNLPHHVWTAAQPFEGDINTSPDVVMRSVWIHGSFMKALDASVIQTGLEVQDELLGPTVNFNPRRSKNYEDVSASSGRLTPEKRDSLHAINGLTNNSWFFNSPLLYWSCSSEAIARDEDIIATVNEGSRRSTSVNVTLRHSIVFSGKRFEDHKLVAADALVITLIHKRDSPVGSQWERKSKTLAKNAPGKWRIFPEDGRVIANQLYEFRFQPLSIQDDIFLGIAYSLVLIYFLLSLTRLRALKSRFGLSAAVISQIALSIMSSFTICAVLKIDLSKIPREAYPVVVLTVGLENMFRLINAVIITASESPTSIRIAEGLGQTGHIALAGVAQNLVILWMLGKVVSPGVAAFCVFAAIALTFDFLYLLTFFVAVLSVEVRRTELSDFLARGGQQPKGSNRELDNSARTPDWADTILRRDLPWSTRISGTIVLIGFVLTAQWHFFDSESPLKTLSRVLQLIWADHKLPLSPPTVLAVNINQARTPTAWLRLQDHETAREVLNVIKPNAHSLIARVYDPLIIVLEGSDRTRSYKGVRPFLPAAYDFVKNQTTRFALTVLFVVASVSLLMNYLLWGEDDMNDDDADNRTQEEPLLAVKDLSNGHCLDIIMLASSPDGVIASVGLDRWIRIWDTRQGVTVHLVETKNRDSEIFPVRALAIDNHAIWLALLSASGQLMFWHIPTRRWGPSAKIDMRARTTLILSLAAVSGEAFSSFTLVRSSGFITECKIYHNGTLDLHDHEIHHGTLVSASQFEGFSFGTAISPLVVTTSRKGNLYISAKDCDEWVSEKIDSSWSEERGPALSVSAITALRSFLAVRKDTIDLIGMDSYTIIKSFSTIKSYPNSVQCFYSTRSTIQGSSINLTSFSLVYTDRESGHCVLQTYTPKRQGDMLCMRAKNSSDDDTGYAWDDAAIHFHHVAHPGKWQILPAGVIVGVHKHPGITLLPKNTESGANPSGNQPRHRPGSSPRVQTPSGPEDDDVWETWTLSAKGERTSITLSVDEDREPSHRRLLVTECGPTVNVGQRSVAVALGNVIKIITVGNETFDMETSDFMANALSTRRRRPGNMRKRVYSGYDR